MPTAHGQWARHLERCQNAWREHRLVKLDFPDELRMRQQVDVIAMRLDETDEGQMLLLCVSLPFEAIFVPQDDEFDDDDFEDDDGYDFF